MNKKHGHLRITNKDDIFEGAKLVDIKGNIRKVLCKTSTGEFWLTHKNSNIPGKIKTFEQIKNDKLTFPLFKKFVKEGDKLFSDYLKEYPEKIKNII